VIAHADLPKPPVLHCTSERITPCFMTVRTLLKDGRYRYHHVILHSTNMGTNGFVSSLG
jgi:hypothetical protein